MGEQSAFAMNKQRLRLTIGSLMLGIPAVAMITVGTYLAIRDAGWKPVLFGFLLFVWLGVALLLLQPSALADPKPLGKRPVALREKESEK